MFSSILFNLLLGRQTTAPVQDVKMNNGSDPLQDEEMEAAYQEVQVPGRTQYPDMEVTDVRPIRSHPLRVYTKDTGQSANSHQYLRYPCRGLQRVVIVM